MQIPNITSALTATLLSVVVSATFAQTISSGPDQLIGRICTNDCAQAAEKLAVDANGNAFAIWAEEGKRIATSRFNASTNQWSVSRTLVNEQGAHSAHIGFDGGGNALAVWVSALSTDGIGIVRFSRYNASQDNWTSPASAFELSYGESLNTVAFGKNGDAVAALLDGRNQDKSARFDAATNTWTGNFGGSAYEGGEIVAVDGVGNIFAVNKLSGQDSNGYVVAERYDVEAKKWTTSFYLAGGYTYHEDPATGTVTETYASGYAPALSVDPYGNATAIWTERIETYKTTKEGVTTTSVTNDVQSARYLKTGVRGRLKDAKISNGKTVNMAVSNTAAGSASVSAIWTQYVGAYAKVVSSRYNASTGIWSTPRVIQSGSFNTRDAVIGTDPQGNAIAAWSQRSDTGTGPSTGKTFLTTSARYSAATGTWGTPFIVQDANRNGYRTQIGVDKNGKAVLLWTQNSGRTTSTGMPVKELRADRAVPQ